MFYIINSLLGLITFINVGITFKMFYVYCISIREPSWAELISTIKMKLCGSVSREKQLFSNTATCLKSVL